MAETYSLSTQGYAADNTIAAAKPRLYLPDSASQRPDTMHAAMALGKQILCQQPDGSQAWYTLDAERSTDANPVLRRA
jgi:hypothetical protein